jgi:hypothetical protein
MTNNLLTDVLSEPLNGATTAEIDISTGSGNLVIDTLPDGDDKLLSGALQYLEKQGRPTRGVSSDHGRAIFRLTGKDAGRPWLRFPWDACNGATEWQIHVNPAVSSDIAVHSGGGNVKVDLAALNIMRHLSAGTGGGNVEVTLPDNAQRLDVDVRTGAGNVVIEIGRGTRDRNTVNATSGAGNVTVCAPHGIAAKIYATSGLGKVVVDSPFGAIGRHIYASSDYDDAPNRVELTVKSGAGNVSVITE